MIPLEKALPIFSPFMITVKGNKPMKISTTIQTTK